MGFDLHVRVVATTSLKNRFTRTPFAPVRLPRRRASASAAEAFGEIVGQVHLALEGKEGRAGAALGISELYSLGVEAFKKRVHD